MQPIEDVLFILGKVSHHAVQEECGLIQQSLRGLNILNHHAARQNMKLRIFFRRKVTTRKDNNRQILQFWTNAKLFKHLKSSHVRQAKVEHDAIVTVGFECFKRSCTGIRSEERRVGKEGR